MSGSPRDWFNIHRKKIQSNPLRGLLHAAFTLYLGFWYTITSRWPFGNHTYEEDWDLLIILDACRVDVLKSVIDEYDFIESVDSRWSVGSHSHEWLTQTFSKSYAPEIAKTAYISGNGHTHETFVSNSVPPNETVPFCQPNWTPVCAEDFGQLDMLWEYAHQEGIGVPPRAVTDRTIKIAREENHERVIAHYMQPHIPYIRGALEEDRQPNNIESKGWKLLESSDADHDHVWKLYQNNLRLALDEVRLLLKNVNAEKVIITADHGNAFGEYSIYGHPEGMLLPCIRKIPWITQTAVDQETHIPSDVSINGQDSETDIEDHLKDLGYM